MEIKYLIMQIITLIAVYIGYKMGKSHKTEDKPNVVERIIEKIVTVDKEEKINKLHEEKESYFD